MDTNRYTYALITSTTYGNWLPGDHRGFVHDHNVYGTPFDVPQPALKECARSNMKESTVFFTQEQATLILNQWLACTENIKAMILALAIMPNHFHMVIVGEGHLTKPKLLQFYKSKASRVLNKEYGKRIWWTDSGSVRFSFDENTHLARIHYVLQKQSNPLVVYEKGAALKERRT